MRRRRLPGETSPPYHRRLAPMQKTLFLYIFKDLMKVFLLASGALAGIMSFGGLLRPLTQHGLDLAQVGQMLAYFMPAMTNYSWPIAALFATTFVYGRMSADNEITACRAAGLSYVHVLLPAALLGMCVTIVSGFFLAFVVPNSFLKAEQVIYSNLAKLVAGQIERTQRINLSSGEDSVTIFARSARVLPAETNDSRDQKVELNDVAIVKYAKPKDKNAPKLAQEFYLADRATAFIKMPDDPDGDVRLWANLENGEKIPAPGGDEEKSLVQMRVETNTSGPYPLASPVRETARFMDVNKLIDLRAHPELSRAIRKHMNELVQIDQQRAAQNQCYDDAIHGRPIVLNGKDGEADASYTIIPPVGSGRSKPRIKKEGDDRVSLSYGSVNEPGIAFRYDHGAESFTGHARELVLTLTPTMPDKIVYTRIEVRDAELKYPSFVSPLQSREWNVAVPMSPSMAALADKTAVQFLNDPAEDRSRTFRTELYRQYDRIEAELHSRFGFAFSCFVLAIVGATIGMMTRSGNFVSAFAVSVGPALLSIVLIVTGQHICETVPRVQGMHVDSPLKLGLTILWAGNVAVVALGSGLYWKLSRT